MSSVGPECYEGYYCREGVNTPAPSENNTGDGCEYHTIYVYTACVTFKSWKPTAPKIGMRLFETIHQPTMPPIVIVFLFCSVLSDR